MNFVCTAKEMTRARLISFLALAALHNWRAFARAARSGCARALPADVAGAR